MGERSWLIPILLSACAEVSAPAPQAPAYGGDVAASPSIEVLPSLDVAPAELSHDMRMGRMLSAESLDLRVPPAPPGSSTLTFSAWSDRDLKHWMSEKARRARAARAQLDQAAVHNLRERVMAGALVGLVCEDVARSLLAIPLPAELSNEPEVAQMFRDVLRSQAQPYLMHAQHAYDACAENALGIETMGHWSSFCRARLERLPQAGSTEQASVKVVATP